MALFDNEVQSVKRLEPSNLCCVWGTCGLAFHCLPSDEIIHFLWSKHNHAQFCLRQLGSGLLRVQHACAGALPLAAVCSILIALFAFVPFVFFNPFLGCHWVGSFPPAFWAIWFDNFGGFGGATARRETRQRNRFL
jgi:hypothetical protein